MAPREETVLRPRALEEPRAFLSQRHVSPCVRTIQKQRQLLRKNWGGESEASVPQERQSHLSAQGSVEVGYLVPPEGRRKGEVARVLGTPAPREREGPCLGRRHETRRRRLLETEKPRPQDPRMSKEHLSPAGPKCHS